MTSSTLVVTLIALATPLAAQPTVGAEVFEQPLTELQAALAAGRITSVQLVDAYLARIAAYDAGGPALNSMLRRNPTARAEAARLDAERRAGKIRGAFHGIPVVLKDNFTTLGMPTSAGSLGLANLVTPDEGPIAARLREGGAIVIGKTNMHELAAGITSISSLGGQTRNPYDPRRCPGGSSGGTGVAVAASFAAVGWGSDTCGSIRIPAAYNSLFGLRPTQGLVSRTGVLPLSHTQDIPGPLARTAMDLAIALDLTIGPDPADPTTAVLRDRSLPRFVAAVQGASLRGVRLGLLGNYLGDADQDIRDTVKAATQAMKGAGAELVDVTIPRFDSLVAGTSASSFETKFDVKDFLAAVPNHPAGSVTDLLERGLYHDAMEVRLRRMDTVSTLDSDAYRLALAKQAVLRERLVVILDSLRLDALVYPTMLRRPVLIGDPQLGGTCQLSAHSGLPALAAPAGFTADGLPVGIELIGRPFDDAKLVAIAAAFEATGPRRRPPPFTPPLVGGRPPAPVSFVATARSADGSVTGRFRFDPSRGELGYRVRVTGVATTALQAVVLRRNRGDTPGPVIHRFVGPGELEREGAVVLTGVNRDALDRGNLSMDLFTTAATLPAASTSVRSPPRRD
jgi:Asp-tRNA(Asn)/Glu-tRNA(Gln) amidotransferase A subunit family amidase